MTNYLLGIDIGTTATKVIIIGDDGRIYAEVSEPATLLSLRSNWAEEDPLEWWDNLTRAIPHCLAEAKIAAHQISCVGLSGMVPTLILVDSNGRPLRNSIQQNDARSHLEINYFKTQVDEKKVFNLTGSAITQQSIGPKLIWLAKNESKKYQQTRWVMGSYDYINFLLTGQPVLERNWALESGLFDLHKEDWDQNLLAIAGISREQLPPVHMPSDVIGHVTGQAASALGLVAGTPVVAGSADHVASAFSVGVKENGNLLIKLGGAGDILYSLDHLDMDERLFLDYHDIPGLYLINGCMASSGSIIKWFRNNFAPECSYSILDDEARNIPPGSDGLVLLPYFLGEKTPIFNPLARGVLFGLSLQHTRAHIYKAILEGISYGFQHHIEVLTTHGLKITRVRVANGGARSQLWRQITADVIGFPLEEVAHHPGSSLGAAFIAGKGIGVFTDWGEIEKFIELKATTIPDPEKHLKYSQYFSAYKKIYVDNIQNFNRLADIEGVTEQN
ncbi:MAG: FGGY-family carbohydrate kinase [Anaerolineaceae bacterium]|nr:FGGY-family carbohydrate kinase [Anaerolineaceae bacterium]